MMIRHNKNLGRIFWLMVKQIKDAQFPMKVMVRYLAILDKNAKMEYLVSYDPHPLKRKWVKREVPIKDKRGGYFNINETIPEDYFFDLYSFVKDNESIEVKIYRTEKHHGNPVFSYHMLYKNESREISYVGEDHLADTGESLYNWYQYHPR